MLHFSCAAPPRFPTAPPVHNPPMGAAGTASRAGAAGRPSTTAAARRRPCATAAARRRPCTTVTSSLLPPRTVHLPNGLEVRCVSRRGVPFLYNEVYAQCSYLRHGITLPRGGTVLDVGANIGLFSLRAAELLGPGVGGWVGQCRGSEGRHRGSVRRCRGILRRCRGRRRALLLPTQHLPLTLSASPAGCLAGPGGCL
jgi:hypothetical protein